VELTLLLLAAFITVATVTVAAVNERVALSWAVIPYLLGLMALWAVTHLALRRWAPSSNGLLFPITALLQGVGFAFMIRIDPELADNHFAWSLAATCAFLLALRGLRDLTWLQKVRPYVGVGGALLLLAPASIARGPRQLDASPVIDLGAISIAPQQLGNLVLITFFAAWLSKYRSRNTAEHLGQVQPLEGDPSRFLPLIGGWLLTSVIIIFHSDMSLAFVTFVIFVSMWWIAAGRIRDLAILLTAIAGSVAVAAGSIAETKSIFAAWIDPWANLELGEASIRSSFALAGGGLTGTGPGGGSADWMPGATDLFAFVPVAEELGFIGGAAILLSYLLLVGVGLRLAVAARTEFDTILASGIAIFFAGQAWASIAAVVRFLPPTGLSLPFVALNGSLLITCNIALALLLRISETAPNISDRTQLLPQITLQSQGDQ
tara:strand:+ start:2481 stop:3782 length:1302 start_codon:yes stop_codon:yes gene_type:complete